MKTAYIYALVDPRDKAVRYVRMNYHAVQVLRQWMALDAQIKRLCAIDIAGQRARLEVESQLVNSFLPADVRTQN